MKSTPMIDRITKWLIGRYFVAVLCNQWGDTGKGKLSDLLAKWADIVIRGTGGANAGHTVYYKGKKYIFHLLPSSIFQDVDNVIGRGVAFDPRLFLRELKELSGVGMVIEKIRLFLAHNALVVMPWHLLEDNSSELSKGIGTTGKGIGPVYASAIARQSIIINDLYNPKVLKRKIKKILSDGKMLSWINSLDLKKAKEILNELGLEVYSEKEIFDVDKIVDLYVAYGEKIAEYARVINLKEYVEKAQANGKRMVLEGAQGLLLSILYGTTTYQTSSDPSINGLAIGCGINLADVDRIFGVTKSYLTRVGRGPFPTELGGKKSEEYCNNEHTKESEAGYYADNIIRFSNPRDFDLGVALRIKGDEYGATTGRLRRCGWLDLVALKYAVAVNGEEICLTKADVLSCCDNVKVCVGYTYLGEFIFYAGKELKYGDVVEEFITDSDILYNMQPIFKILPGWGSLDGITEYDELPFELRAYIDFIEEHTGGYVSFISTGPNPEDSIFRNLKEGMKVNTTKYSDCMVE